MLSTCPPFPWSRQTLEAQKTRKDAAAKLWCEHATTLTDKKWRYTKVLQLGFEKLQRKELGDLAALGEGMLL